ncbi:MAG: exodeoxyribonuclease VII small subunit [Treponema sp.]|nr:exodeoxyribonuclease VII small subunit [Treponema sp.]
MKNNFEENLEKLEKLSSDIKRSDISLEDALKDFEEGIKLAHGMEKQLDEIEGKIQILMNEPNPMDKDNPPQMELFEDRGEVQGTRQ